MSKQLDLEVLSVAALATVAGGADRSDPFPDPLTGIRRPRPSPFPGGSRPGPVGPANI